VKPRAAALILCAILLATPLVLGQDQDPKAVAKSLKKALKANDVAGATAAIRELVVVNDGEAVAILVKTLASIDPKTHAQLYWLTIHSTCCVTHPGALQQLAELIVKNKKKPFARDLVSSLHTNLTEGVPSALAVLIEEGSVEMQVIALEHLAEFGQPASVEIALQGWESAKNELIERKCHQTLIELTGRDLGPAADLWRGWWDANRPEELPTREQREEAEATGTAVDLLDRTRTGEYERLKKAKLVVLAGRPCMRDEYDHNLDKIDQLLASMQIPSQVIRKDEIEKPGFRFPDGTIAVLANCTHWRGHCGCNKCVGVGTGSMRLAASCGDCNVHVTCHGELSQAGLDVIRDFVQRGGYLFTEDWAMGDIVERVWPTFLEGGTPLPGGVTEITPRPGAAAHPYLRRVFHNAEGGAGATRVREYTPRSWKIDTDSPKIGVKDPNAVQVLIESDTVGPVALTFTPARVKAKKGEFEQDRTKMQGGRVLHVLSHFGEQEAPADELTIQNLLLNFLIEASERSLQK